MIPQPLANAMHIYDIRRRLTKLTATVAIERTKTTMLKNQFRLNAKARSPEKANNHSARLQYVLITVEEARTSPCAVAKRDHGEEGAS